MLPLGPHCRHLSFYKCPSKYQWRCGLKEFVGCENNDLGIFQGKIFWWTFFRVERFLQGFFGVSKTGVQVCERRTVSLWVMEGLPFRSKNIIQELGLSQGNSESMLQTMRTKPTKSLDHSLVSIYFGYVLHLLQSSKIDKQIQKRMLMAFFIIIIIRCSFFVL